MPGHAKNSGNHDMSFLPVDPEPQKVTLGVIQARKQKPEKKKKSGKKGKD